MERLRNKSEELQRENAREEEVQELRRTGINGEHEMEVEIQNLRRRENCWVVEKNSTLVVHQLLLWLRAGDEDSSKSFSQVHFQLQ